MIASIKQWTGEHLIGDDCALLPGQTLVTADTLVEGTHFLTNLISMSDLGWKAVAVNLSDIAAMSGRPRFVIVSLTLPETFRESEFAKLYEGMIDCARAYRTRIVGGDLTRGPCLSLSLTVLGDVHEKGCILRSGAQVGDVVVVTGTFGASAAGLWILQNETAGFNQCRRAHVRPLPRLCESWALVRQTGGRAALMDASDGLADALIQISGSSSVGMEIDELAVPISAETREVARLAQGNAIDLALYGGEDYELVGCLSPSDWYNLQQSNDNPFNEIGRVVEGSEVLLRGKNGTVALDLSRTYQHWRSDVAAL